MKRSIPAILLLFMLFHPVFASANPVPDEDDQNIILIARGQSICVVLFNLVTDREHRLVRESEAGDEMLLDGEMIADAGLTADGRYVVADTCVPEGLVTYRLYRKSGDGWNEYADSGASTFASEGDGACADEAAICDGAAEEAEPYEETDDPVCGCNTGGEGSVTVVAAPGLLLLGVWTWLRKRRGIKPL